MFVDDAHLSLPEGERDVYGAYEIMLMRPIWHKEHTYDAFLAANGWAKAILPHAFPKKNHELKKTQRTRRVNPLEGVFHAIGTSYMRKRKTTEVIEAGRIRFHPNDARVSVMREFESRLRKFRMLR